MLVGDINILAIESDITHVYSSLGQRGLGFFVVWVGGKRYGVYSPEATLLACSYDEVSNRIARRRQHVVPFLDCEDALSIAEAYLQCTYYDDQNEGNSFRLTCPQLQSAFSVARPVWAPDGDEAFDDGSHILHFDQSENVRLIAFKNSRNNSEVAASLSEVTLTANTLYSVLREWRGRFEADWMARIKLVN